MPDDLMTALEAAALTGRPIGTVRSWISTGKLRVWRRGLRSGSWQALVSRAEVDEVAARMAVSPQGRGNRGRGGNREREPTAEQVEALVAEQMKALPDWWADDAAKQNERRTD